MDHFTKAVSKERQRELGVYPDPADPLFEIIAQMGAQHEKEVIKTHSILKINRGPASLQKTLSAMKGGAPAIYQGAISANSSKNKIPIGGQNSISSRLFGYVDILEKTKGDSVFGDYHYTAYDIKIASHPSPSAVIQLCCYSDILLSVQKRLPQKIKIITKDKRVHSFDTKKFFYFYQLLKESFLNYHLSFDLQKIPLPNKSQDHKKWNGFSKKVLQSLDDISLTADIRQSQCEKLKQSNINTMTELAQSKKNHIQKMAGSTFQKLKSQARLQVSSRETNKIQFEILQEEGLGLESLPPPHPADIFFDMEGYPLFGEDGLEYLYGNVIHEQPEYLCFWAEKKSKEATAFKHWIDWAYERWEKNPDLHIYHYGHYESSTLKRLMSRYGIGEAQVDDFLRGHVFVDLHRVVKQGLRLGLSSYSLKEIEKLYYDKRETEVQSGGDSAVQFFHFLNSGSSKKSSPFLKKIEDYNRDDCFSTKELCQFLWALQKKHGISYTPQKQELAFDEKKRSIRRDCQEKAQQILSLVPLEKRSLSLKEADPKLYLAELLASLLEFHIREEKPGWWTYFEHFKKEEAERLEDRDIISSCRLVRLLSNKCEIQFEKEQELDFKAGDKVIVLENNKLSETYQILRLDLIKKRLWLNLPKHHNIPKEGVFNLAPAQEIFYKTNIFKSLLETARSFSFDKPRFGLKKCIHDLLLKTPPDLPNHKGDLVSSKENLIEEVSHHVLNLKGSILCVQGPPGSGKTYTAAHIILNLIQKGKRVGVTSNSHKAILNLLIMLCKESKTSFLCQKIFKTGAKEEEQKTIGPLPIKLVEKADSSAQVVGATTYFFTKEKDNYDYLFIDEASQLSLANTVAAGRAARNIILLGDQNQLDQPIQAAHPGESGQSALSYYTDGQNIIPRGRGIFLPVSYRLNPKICRFVSDNFYDGNLSPKPENQNQKILLPPDLKGKLPDSGICFIPVNHSGNREASEEEVLALSSLYKALLQAKWMDKTKKIFPVTSKDILITAPYNLQVSYIKRALSYEGLRTASVDKFQGQEAPISILSMSASSIESAPRGIAFLLNKNRLNVAISRAQCLSIIIGSINLLDTNISTLPNMELMNIWSQIANKNA